MLFWASCQTFSIYKIRYRSGLLFNFSGTVNFSVCGSQLNDTYNSVLRQRTSIWKNANPPAIEDAMEQNKQIERGSVAQKERQGVGKVYINWHLVQFGGGSRLVETEFDEYVKSVCHRVVDRRVAPWMAQWPESRSFPRKTALKAIAMKDMDRFAGVLDKTRLNVVVFTH